MIHSLRFFIILAILSVILISCKEDRQTTKSEKSIVDFQSLVLDNDRIPIINAEVQFVEKGEIIAVDTTDEFGNFSFKEVEAILENLNLKVNHTFYNSITIPYSDISDYNENIILELKEDCCISTKIIVKDKDENPIKGVKIQLRKDMKTLKKGTSDKNGIVEFSGICADEYEFRISADGYEVVEKIENIEKCDETYEYSYSLNSKENEDCCESTFIFKPQNKDGEILNGTKIYIYKDGKIIQDPVVKDGKAILDNLCEGKYVIVYKNENYQEKEVAVELGCDEEKTLEHVLSKKDDDCCDAIMKFLVKDNKSKEYLKGASVTLKLDGKTIFEDRKTNADGYVIEDNLCKGKYTVIIKMDGYKTIETTWNVEKCDDFQEHFWLEKEDEDCCESAFIFKPRNKDGEILNGTKIYIYKDGKIIQDPVVKDGKAILDNLCEGKYVIVYKNENYQEKEVAVELGCDEEKTLEHILSKKDDDCCDAILKFLVKDNKSKEYLKGASVTLKLDGKTIFEDRKTNADGYVIEDNLCKGKYTVIIKMDGYKTIETTWNIEKCDDFQEHFWLEQK